MLTLCFSILTAVTPNMASRSSTALAAFIPESEMTADQREIMNISRKWAEVRLMDKEQAADLEPEWKEAHDRYFEKYHKDMESMQDIAGKLEKMIEPPQVQKKSKGQKKRDAYAKVVARETARAAAAK